MALTNPNFINTCTPTAATNTQHIKTSSTILSTITTIFFDLDNTLIPTRSGDSKACRRVAGLLEIQYGFSKEEANYATQSFLKSFRCCPDNIQTSLDIWRIHLWRESLPPKYQQLAETIYPLWLEMRYRYLAIPDDYIEMLNRLRQANYQLALITNGPSNAQWEKVRKLQVQPYFDCIIVSSDLPWEKPNPNIFYAACKYLNVHPQHCAMIGDKLEIDIKGGILAGLCATFWLPPTPEAIQNLIDNEVDEHHPTHILRNLLDIYKYFNINLQVPVYDNNQSNKCRRSGLLPRIEYLSNSETDNSSENSSESIN